MKSLEGVGVYNYLSQLKLKFNLEYDFDIQKARCSICNSILRKIHDKNQIINDVKPQTLNYFKNFYRCTNPKCKKIFWKGSHIEKIISRLKK